MSSWREASEEKLASDGFCEHCQQEVKSGESLWVLDGDVRCTNCRQKEIDKGN